MESELSKAEKEKRMVEKKADMIMEEMYGMKKKLEEEKGRSISFNRAEETNRIRWLENENEKKDKLISRCTKEKFELEEENVRLNVQVMKLLS